MKHSVKVDRHVNGSIRLRVSFDKHRVELFIGESCSENEWRNGRAVGKGSTRLNAVIAQKVADIDTIFQRCEVVHGRYPTNEELKNCVKGVVASSGTVTDCLDEFTSVEGSRGGWAYSTVQKFRTLKMHVTEYDRNARINSVDDVWLHGFVAHLQRHGMRNTTIAKNLKLFRWFLSWASREKHYEGNSHTTFRPKLKGTTQANDIIYLEWDELQTLINAELPEALHIHRQVFVFQCFTGLRYSDLYNLRKKDISDGRMKITTKKTADTLTIDLNDTALAILDELSVCATRGKALPVISNVNYNLAIHDMCRLAGLDRAVTKVYYVGGVRHEESGELWQFVTSHAARRTFVVNALRLKIPAEVIMSWTGHKDYDAMKPYIKIVDELKRSEMAKFNTIDPKIDPPNDNTD